MVTKIINAYDSCDDQIKDLFDQKTKRMIEINYNVDELNGKKFSKF